MTDSVANIISKYGDIITPATELIDNEPHYIPISPSIDLALGGKGVPEGSLVIMIGPPGCGKSTTALQFLSNAIRPENDFKGKTRHIFYEDVEHRLKKMNLTGVVGLDPDKINHIHSAKGKYLTAEDFLNIGEELVKSPENEGCFLVIDSSSALCPADEMVKGADGQIRSVFPKMMSHWCKKMAGPIRVMSSTVVIIQHLITNTSGYGEKWVSDGGEKLKFHSNVRMITKGKPKEWIENDIQVGQVIEWDITKSSGGQSGLTATSYLRYGYGLDFLKEKLVLASDFGIIVKAGSWYKFGTEKFQGENKLYDAMKDNPDLLKEVDKQLDKVFKR
jgi:recombination protein RecA